MRGLGDLELVKNDAKIYTAVKVKVKGKKNIVINCLTGMRSKVAWSLLARHNIEAKVFTDNFTEFKNKGYNVVEYKG